MKADVVTVLLWLQEFSNCSCVEAGSNGRYSEAKEGKCEADCGLLALFLTFMFGIVMLAFTSNVPALSATLRCVSDKQRSFALSLQWIIVRCLGSIPGPIIFGRVIDETCIFWKESCDAEQGACYYYDNNEMSNYFLALTLGCKVVSIITLILSLVLYKPPPGKDVIEIVTNVDPVLHTPVTNPSLKGIELEADCERKNGHTVRVET